MTRTNTFSNLLVVLALFLCGLASVQASDPCNICGENGVVGNLFAEHMGQTCEEWKGIGERGEFSGATECANVQASGIFEACECRVVTLSPTPAPTPLPTTLTTVKGEIVIVLMNVTNEMSPSIRKDYEMDLEAFFTIWFPEVVGAKWPGVIKDWTVKVDEQIKLVDEEEGSGRNRRGLRSPTEGHLDHRRLTGQGFAFPLETRLTVTAQASQTKGRAAFEDSLQETLDMKEAELLVLLKKADSVVTKIFFTPSQTTETFLPDEVVTTQRAKRIPEPTDNKEKEGDSNNNGGSGSKLDNTAIAGIAAAAGFVLILIVGVLCVACRPDKAKKDGEDNFGGSLDRGAIMSPGGSQKSGVSSRYRSRQLGNARSSTTRIVAADGRTLSVLQHSSQEFQKGDSYPESAPPRDGDVYDTPVFDDEGLNDEGEDQDGIMMTSERSYQDYPDDPHQGYYEGGSYQEQSYQDQDHSYQEQSYQEQSYQDQSYQAASSQQEYADGGASYQNSSQPESLENSTIPTVEGGGGAPVMVTREVTAPPGKLGIVIETTLEGPVVHKINPASPLVGVVFEGDLIAGIDDVDTRAMSASAITALMVRTADHPRRMIIKSEA